MKLIYAVIFLLPLLVSPSNAQTKHRLKKKPKPLPTVYQVAQPRQTSPAEKQEWTHLTGDISKNGKIQTVYRYQTDSLRELTPHVFKFWLEASETEKKITYRSLFLFEVNCQTKEYRLVRHIAYGKDGTLLTDNRNKEAQFDDIAPGTMAAIAFTKICVIAGQ